MAKAFASQADLEEKKVTWTKLSWVNVRNSLGEN